MCYNRYVHTFPSALEEVMSMAAKKPSNGGDNRDAGTGRFVTGKYAKKHPGTTIHESGKKYDDPRVGQEEGQVARDGRARFGGHSSHIAIANARSRTQFTGPTAVTP
jgi:hypothetical protein